MTLTLQNPRGIVLSATLTVQHEGRSWLSVSTIYGNSASGHKSERGAKAHFTKEFLGGKNKWKNA